QAISVQRTRHNRRRFASTSTRNAKYTRPAATARPATVSTTVKNAGTRPIARPTRNTVSLIARPMTIARPGMVYNSAPRRSSRRSAAAGGFDNDGSARRFIADIVDFAILKHVQFEFQRSDSRDISAIARSET